MNEPTGIYVVDDEPDVLAAVQALLAASGLDSRGFTSASAFLEDVDLTAAACLVTDVQMPGLGGVDLQRRLRAADSPISVVVVSGAVDVPTAVKLMEDGAVTLLEKPYAMRDLLAAVERACAASRARLRQRRETCAAGERFALLTSEERDVLRLMLAGAPNKAIAAQLALSPRTVDRRRQAVLQKLAVESPAQLARLVAALPTGTLGGLD